MFTTNSMSKLQVQTTYKAERLYMNQGTHGDEDLCIWEPTLPDGYFMIGHYAQRNHDMVLGGPIPIVKTTDPKICSNNEVAVSNLVTETKVVSSSKESLELLVSL